MKECSKCQGACCVLVAGEASWEAAGDRGLGGEPAAGERGLSSGRCRGLALGKSPPC